MNITDEVARLESEGRDKDARIHTLEKRVAMQAGAIDEGRAQNRQLILRNEKLAAQIARYDKHFRDVLGSGESLIQHAKELEPELPGVPAEQPVPHTLKSKIASLVKRNGEAA